MEIIFQQHVQRMKDEPTALTEITESLLRELTKEHHPHNKLLPAAFIAQLLQYITPQSIVDTNVKAKKHILAINSLRAVIVINFTDYSQNKMFTAILLNYTQTLKEILTAQRSQAEQQDQNLKFAARGFILNEIMLKMIQRAHVYVPEILRFAKIVLEKSIHILKQMAQNEIVNEKQFKNLSKCQENSKIPKLLFALGYKKQWKKSYLLIFVNLIYLQIQNYVKSCGFSKHIKGQSIIKQIQQNFQLFKNCLSESQRSLLTAQQQHKEVNENQQQMYLEEPIQVRELTPRFYDEEQSMIMAKLRRKKSKLTKKIEGDLRKSVIVKQQQAQVLQDVRKDKKNRLHKKELLILQKQTVQAKKFDRQMKKVKHIKKAGKSSKASGNKTPGNKKR